MKRSIESAVWCTWYRCLVCCAYGHPTQSNTESTNVGVWAVVMWQWFVTEELSVGKGHKEESGMIYTPTHDSCTASVMLCIRALPHPCLLYSDACVSVLVNADKHAFVYFESNFHAFSLHVHVFDIRRCLAVHAWSPSLSPCYYQFKCIRHECGCLGSSTHAVKMVCN